MPQYREGQTATNPKTGQKIRFEGGFWVDAGKAQGGAGLPNPEIFRKEKDTLSAIDDIEKRSGFWTTGLVGGWLRDVPGTPAYQLNSDIDTLKARSAFGELAAMRAASPTGGALGNVTEKELGLLQAATANLDTGQGEKQLDKNLGRVREGVQARTPGLTVDNPIDLTTGGSRQPVPRGATRSSSRRRARRLPRPFKARALKFWEFDSADLRTSGAGWPCCRH
jgi:hypothetical protein